MDMSLGECWDCPTPLLSALIEVGVTFAFLLGAVRLYRSRAIAVRVVGGIVFGIWCFGVMLCGNYFVRHGISLRRGLYANPFLQLGVLCLWFGGSGFLLGRASRAVAQSKQHA